MIGQLPLEAESEDDAGEDPRAEAAVDVRLELHRELVL